MLWVEVVLNIIGKDVKLTIDQWPLHPAHQMLYNSVTATNHRPASVNNTITPQI